MKLIAIKTPFLKSGEDIFNYLLKSLKLFIRNGDLIVIASKIISLAQNRIINLKQIKPSEKFKKIAREYDLDPRLVNIIYKEADKIIGGSKGAILTLKQGLLVPNAGIDQSNIEKNKVILWPTKVSQAADSLKNLIADNLNKKVGIVISDSHCQPTRLGTTAQALAIAGFEGIRDFRKEKDLYGNKLKITQQNLVDSLACAANLLMGEGKGRIPMVIIRDLPVKFSNENARALTGKLIIKPNQCLYYETGLYKKKILG